MTGDLQLTLHSAEYRLERGLELKLARRRRVSAVRSPAEIDLRTLLEMLLHKRG